MASVGGLAPTFSGVRSGDGSSSRPTCPSVISFSFYPELSQRKSNHRRIPKTWKFNKKICRAMVQQTVQGGPSATYAREMERLSAKESLLLAFKDAGGFESLVTGKTTDMQRIDVTERITSLERLNPTPRPTTSPFLEGGWNIEWFGSEAPGLFATRFAFERLPTTLANLSKMDVWIKDGYAKLTANMRFLNSIETKLVLSSKLSVEGPLRMKEEMIEGLLESPTLIEDAVPEQIKSAIGQLSGATQQLPVPIRDAFSSGLRVPLSGAFQRLFMISYLDEEILAVVFAVIVYSALLLHYEDKIWPVLIIFCSFRDEGEGLFAVFEAIASEDIIRDTAGLPEVLIRLDTAPVAEPMTEYES